MVTFEKRRIVSGAYRLREADTGIESRENTVSVRKTIVVKAAGTKSSGYGAINKRLRGLSSNMTKSS